MVIATYVFLYIHVIHVPPIRIVDCFGGLEANFFNPDNMEGKALVRGGGGCSSWLGLQQQVVSVGGTRGASEATLPFPSPSLLFQHFSTVDKLGIVADSLSDRTLRRSIC